MAEGKVEPVEDKVGNAAASSELRDSHSTPSPTPAAQQSPSTSTPDSSARTSVVRNSVLDEVVAQHNQRIAELERKVEKRKETYRRLSSPSPFIPPHGLGVVSPQAPPSGLPTGSAPPPSPALQNPSNQTNQVSAAGNASNAKQHQSQPLAHNPTMAATIAAITAASTPTVSAALHPQYPFYPYPHPDSPVMASPFMGVVPTVPPHPTHQHVQPPAPTRPSRPNAPSEDGGPAQSRYWTRDEHERFLLAVNTYGSKNYQQIAEVVGTRNAKQVRTHSQKYQKKLEREEARRRGDGRTPTGIHSQTHKGVVSTAGITDSEKEAAQKQLREGGSHPDGPTTASSKPAKSNEAPHSAKSAEGSSSTNNASSKKNTDGGVDGARANEKAAAAAVLAEAVALGGGSLPPGALPMLNGSNAAKSSSRDPAISPDAPGAVRSIGGRVAVTTNGATLTNSTKKPEKQSKTTTGTDNRTPPHKHENVSRHNEKAAVIMPAKRGRESHQLGNRTFEQKTHETVATIVPILRPTNSSAHGAVVCSQVGPDIKPEAKLTRAAVKIEPRVATFQSRNGLRPVPSSAAEAASHSQHEAPPRATSLNPVIKTANTNDADKSTCQESQEPKNLATDRSVGSGEGTKRPLTINTGTTDSAKHSKALRPNGTQDGRAASPKAPQNEQGVDGKIDSNMPALADQITESAPALSSDANDRNEVTVAPKSGNSKAFNKSERSVPNGETGKHDKEPVQDEIAHDTSPNDMSERRACEKATESSDASKLAANKIEMATVCDAPLQEKGLSKQSDKHDQAVKTTDPVCKSDPACKIDPAKKSQERTIKADAEVGKPCSSPKNASGASLSAANTSELSARPNGDSCMDVFQNHVMDSQVDQTEGGRPEGSRDGGSGSGDAEEKGTGRDSKNPGSDETGNMRWEELKRGDMKRGVRDAAESVAKRQRGIDGGSRKRGEVVEKFDVASEVEG